ncbi:MAG: pyridoxamine 5'-phosphate oxidase family protein [Gemmobacter sp.]|jgi:general stress protein 26|nr:pyridoxamine 5'-phosphate oxidase family protein [Gemmobacter sp.]
MTADADAKITAAFWKHLRSDRTVMLGLEDSAPTSLRPMTALLEEDADHGPVWFFTSTETELANQLKGQDLAIFTFASKGHDIFATVHGHMTLSKDRATIDRLWSPFVAAWYEGGKDDPKLVLLRFDPAQAEIWRDGSSFLAGLKLLFGSDPKKDFKDDVAKVSLS